MNRKEMRKLVEVTEQKADKPRCDATKLLVSPEAFASACEELGKLCKKLGAYDLILSPDGLGLVIGAAIATTHKSGFVPALKSSEAAPSEETHLAASQRDGKKTDVFSVPAGAIKPGCRVLVVDDILASGGTTLTLARAVEELGGEVVGVATLAEMTARHGRMALEARGYQVRALLRYGG